MNILRYIFLWILAFLFTSAIDAVWHLVIFRKSYSEGMKPLARMTGERIVLKPVPGLLAQILVVTCIVVLILYGMQKGQLWEAALIGALCGILAITVYGFTNYAILKNWNMTLTILEVVWGPILGGLSGIFVFWMKSLLFKQ